MATETEKEKSNPFIVEILDNDSEATKKIKERYIEKYGNTVPIELAFENFEGWHHEIIDYEHDMIREEELLDIGRNYYQMASNAAIQQLVCYIENLNRRVDQQEKILEEIRWRPNMPGFRMARRDFRERLKETGQERKQQKQSKRRWKRKKIMYRLKKRKQ